MYSRQFLTGLYRTMYTIRVFETRCIKLYRQGIIHGYLHPYLGEEAIATGVCAALRPQDYITSTHRGHGHCIARGGQLKPMMAEITGREAGYCRGRGGSMHIADLSTGNLGANGIVGAGVPIGVGAAMGAWIRGEDRVAAVFTSDGAANNGVFAEGLNLAASLRLPFILVVENNQYAVSTPIEQSTAQPELFRRGLGYGVNSERVDGNDVLTVYAKTVEAIELCQRGGGPVLIEAVTYRHGGHHVNDPGQYMPKDRLEHYLSRDPLLLGRAHLLEAGGTAEDVAEIESHMEREMDEAIEFALNCPQSSVEAFLEEVRAN
jgi:TPP-dependent pyruvate/acetoin dehydrogenase alpha subunit